MILYELGLRTYSGIIRLVSPFNPKAKQWITGRHNIFRCMAEAIDPTDRVAWFHCASLGEFEQGRPLMEAFRAKYPQYKLLVTFFSPSGYEVRKGYKGADYIFYLPIDTKANVTRFMEIVHPEVAIFVKYEFWRNYLTALRGRGAKTYVVSAIFRDDQPFFKWYGGPFRKMLRCFTRIFVQNNSSQALLAGIGISNVTVAGDTRFDRVGNIATTAKRIESIEAFAQGARVVVAGSTWPKDDDLMIEAIAAHPEYKFIIAPHEIEESKIVNIISRIDRKCVRHTLLDHYTAQEIAASEVYLVDMIGILSSVYQYGTCAYIGGGFGVGIHNTLEAATFGLPLMFGPNYKRFKEAVDLIALQGAQCVATYADVDEVLTLLERDPQVLQERSVLCKAYVARNVGACEKILKFDIVP